MTEAYGLDSVRNERALKIQLSQSSVDLAYSKNFRNYRVPWNRVSHPVIKDRYENRAAGDTVTAVNASMNDNVTVAPISNFEMSYQ